MAIIGEVTGIEYKINRDGDEKKMLLQAILEDVEDPQTVEYIQRGGEQTPPVDGSRVIVLDIEQAYKIGIAFDDDTPPDETLVPGDKKFYSLLLTPGATEDDPDTVTIQGIIKILKTGEISFQASDGQKEVKQLAKIKLTPTGTVEINSTDDQGVEKATIKMKANGDIELDAAGGGFVKIFNNGNTEINGNDDTAILFAKFKEQIDQMITDLNNLIIAYNGHAHPPIVFPTNMPAVSTAVDFADAEAETVFLKE